MTIIRAGSEPAPTYYNYYYTYDGLGSVSEITDEIGNVIEKYSYDIYGKVTIRNANNEIIPTSQIGNRYYFTGRELDAETCLYYYRARHYSPSLGRFIQRDPIGYYDSMNLYAYCGNNPVNYVDPTGTIAGVDDATILIFIAVGGALAINAATNANPYSGQKSSATGSNRTPSKGEPGSTETFPDGKGKTERTYGPDGKAQQDVDYGHDHGAGDPHVHDWDWTKPRGEERGKGDPIKEGKK